MKIEKENLEQAFKMLKVLLHPQKIWIAEEVRKRGYMIGREIWKELEIAQSVGSKFTNELVDINILTKKKVGSTYQFSLIEENFNIMLELSEKISKIANIKTN